MNLIVGLSSISEPILSSTEIKIIGISNLKWYEKIHRLRRVLLLPIPVKFPDRYIQQRVYIQELPIFHDSVMNQTRFSVLVLVQGRYGPCVMSEQIRLPTIAVQELIVLPSQMLMENSSNLLEMMDLIPIVQLPLSQEDRMLPPIYLLERLPLLGIIMVQVTMIGE